MNKNNIVLTGGHAATTAIATIESLNKKLDHDTQIHWIGVRKAVEGKSALTLEAKILPEMGVKFHNLMTGRIQAKFTRYSIISLLKIPFGFAHSLFLLLQIRPKLVLSFGGFAAFPVVFWAKLIGIKTIIHEQTAEIGTANKYSLMFADIVAISRSSSKKYLGSKEFILTGNPISSSIAQVKPKVKLVQTPTIFVLGGSRGSVHVNAIVYESLPILLKEYEVIHLTGELDYENFRSLRSVLPRKLKRRYKLVKWIKPDMMHTYYERADLAISRAGANTVSELVSCGIPAVYIPIPWSKYDEQMQNAKYAKKLGLGEIVDQRTVSSKQLIKAVKCLSGEWQKSRQSIKRHKSLDKDAADNLSQLVLSYL